MAKFLSQDEIDALLDIAEDKELEMNKEKRKFMKETTFENARVGDRVWDFMSGWGKIVTTETHSERYPIRVRFENNSTRNYNKEGRCYITVDEPKTLFWDEIKFEVPAKHLPDLQVDTRVLVWDDPTRYHKYKAYFSSFDSDGKIVCFNRGRTSWSSENLVTWEYWELAED